MIFEHEGLHLETLLYMLAQMPPRGVLPPPGFTKPDWPSLKKRWDVEAAGSKRDTVMEFGKTTVTVGHDDVDADDDVRTPFDPEHEYGWDNESPRRTVTVEPFKISSRPITNAEYLAFLESSSDDGLVPSSWVKTGSGEFNVRTVYGPVGLDVARHWPVQASGQQLSRYAASRGGRLPTADELRLFRSKTSVAGAASNVGFRNWHPVPASSETSGNGGVWEWTSTVFAPHDGFVGSALYPGYSADFFDGTHWVVLGGSWATIPRIAGRQSVTNWYQANVRLPFCSRLADPG